MSQVTAATVSFYETEQLFFSGEYERCQQVAALQVARGVWNEQWPELLVRCHLTRGNYEAAVAVFETGLKRFGNRIAYRMAGIDVYRLNNRTLEANEQLAELMRMVQSKPWRYGSMRDQVMLGRLFVILGEDARQILEVLYDRVRKRQPKFVDVYIATAELALDKHDDALAAEQLQIAAELQPQNPQIYFLLARSLRESDSVAATAALSRALKINPRHVPSLLLQVDQAIDAEQYEQAESLLEQISVVNLRHPRAWAYHAVLAHLAGHYEGEEALRSAALSIWQDNHEVDHLIGTKLSQKYRFREGVAYQRRALDKQPDYLPSQFQLAHDLLRIGEESEGWRRAGAVQEQDPYHVVAFNLAQLKERLDQFRTLTSEHFVVRMDAREANIYGRQVTELLERAYTHLCPKYEVELTRPVHVEIFPRQQDFAIRTFGLPGGAGYLGVCFGPLITANSPAAQGASPTNWQSILWHEFCHVVTLEKTRNRMPRWLSEGVSVYEERQQNPGWGQSMTPEFRSMILSDELTPVSELSGAFLHPRSGAHLQFAYFESSLVVEFLIERLGLDTLRRMLTDLSVGMPINASLERYVGAITAVDAEFSEFARGRARDYGNQLEWQPAVDRVQASPKARERLLSQQPNNYWLALDVGKQYIQQGDWPAARTVLERIHQLHPTDASPKGVMRSLVRVYRHTGDELAEMKLLESLAELDADAIDVDLRLIQLARKSDDWHRIHKYASHMLAVNPMIRVGQEALIEASQTLDRPQDVVDGQSALIELQPPDPAAAHYQLAQAQASLGQRDNALRHVLIALEEAPRYRAAHRLLLKLVDTTSNTPTAGPSSNDAPDGSTIDAEARP